MAHERITEDIVREHFKNDLLMNSDEVITVKEQKDEKLVHLFENASKNEKGNKGYPEFIVSFKRIRNLKDSELLMMKRRKRVFLKLKKESD